MRKFQRLPEPAFLAENKQKWTGAWIAKRNATPPKAWAWPQYEKQRINIRLLDEGLKTQTQNHCSFCDHYPVSPPGVDTIEHFKPKSRFPEQAFEWENLYYCCNFCQQKNNNYDEDLLRPDAEDFVFDRYFRWDYTTGELLVNSQASEEDQNRAKITIKIYALNNRHPAWRRREQRQRSRNFELPIDEFAYRDFIES